MSQLEPGVRALIVGATTLTENIGKTCKIASRLRPGEKFICPVTGVKTTYSPGSPPGWLIVGEGVVGRRSIRGVPTRIFGVGAALDKHLMPIDSSESKSAEEFDKSASN